MEKRQLITSEESIESPVQHTKPCSDCPFARTALNGWLGGVSIEEWLERARTRTLVPCHTISNQQCAGLAIFRRNMCQLPEAPLLVLQPDRETCFANPMEFTEHHQAGFGSKKGKKRRCRRK